MKTRTRIWMVWVVLGLVLAACAPPATPTPVERVVEVTRIVEVVPTPVPTPTPRFAGVTLTLIDNPEGQTEAMIALQKRCEERTGVRLNVEVVPHDQVRPKLFAALSAKLPTYDIFYIDIIDLPQYAAAGYVYPIDQFITPEMEGGHPALRGEGGGLRRKVDGPSLEGGVDVLRLQQEDAAGCRIRSPAPHLG